MPRQLAPHQQSEPPLSPRSPTPSSTWGQGSGRHLCGGMQIFVKTYSRSDEDQKTKILGKIPTEEGHQTLGKILAGDGSAPRQGPHQGCQQGHRQARTNQVSAAIRMQLPARLAGLAPAWQHAASRPDQQVPAWRHADLREDPTTTPPQLPACLHGAARIASQGA